MPWSAVLVLGQLRCIDKMDEGVSQKVVGGGVIMEALEPEVTATHCCAINQQLPLGSRQQLPLGARHGNKTNTTAHN